MKQPITTLLCCICFLSPAFSQVADSSADFIGKQVNLAVLDFEGRNVAKADAASLADRFRYELIKTNKFDVMERNQMNLILEEQDFQRSDCVDQSCAVEAGQLIAVAKIVTGAVSKVGGIYSLTVKVIDVATGRVDINIAEDCDCPIEKVLTETMRRLALKTAGIKVEEVQTVVSVQRGDASLFIKTEPPGANIYIDGKMMDGVTPTTLGNLTAGKHVVMVQRADMHAKKEVELVGNQVTRLSLTLKKQMTLLKVMSNPTDAEVYLGKKPGINTRPNKVTPAIFENVQEDSVSLTLFKIGYNDTTVTVPIIANDENTVSLDLKEVDADRIQMQRKLVRNRSQRRASFFIGGFSLALGATGALMYHLGSLDYDDALHAKRTLERSTIKAGPQWEALLKENRDKTDSGNLKRTLAHVFGWTGVGGLTLAVVLYF